MIFHTLNLGISQVCGPSQNGQKREPSPLQHTEARKAYGVTTYNNICLIFCFSLSLSLSPPDCLTSSDAPSCCVDEMLKVVAVSSSDSSVFSTNITHRHQCYTPLLFGFVCHLRRSSTGN